jgi:lysophospholipase L1-like esterase
VGCAKGSGGDDRPQGSTGGEGGQSASSSGGGAGAPSTASHCENSSDTLERYAITEASPIISIDANIQASGGVGDPTALVDGNYKSGSATFSATDDWVALEVEGEPSALLLYFSEPGYGEYDAVAGAPVNYRIEVSGDSTDGSDGTWEEVHDITDNTVRNRAHSFDFEGKKWVRFVIGEMEEERTILLDEIELHDISNMTGDRPQDTWLMFGDSIAKDAFHKQRNADNFYRRVAAAHEGFSPTVVNASIGGGSLGDALLRLEETLELNPDMQYVGVAYGTNDSWDNTPEQARFEENLRNLVDAILEAGRTPVLARIPHGSRDHDNVPQFNIIIDAVQAEYYLPCGPDLFTWFFENAEDGLSPDEVHPNNTGYSMINELWAEAVSPLYAN